ncbi:MAG: hypothetical protein EBS07_02605 [Sphingobacteriia bacterium]|jgi:hypothetical protein|nr:hypothetical protein [Sphingobacteriia bacterium]
MASIRLGVGSRINHPEFGDGVVINYTGDTYKVSFLSQGVKEVAREFSGISIIEALDPDEDAVSLEDVEKIMVRILRKWSDTTELVPLGQRWTGGKMILQPGDRTMASKEVPIETFFHKIVMVRDRLRTMEQRVNASQLSDEEKINIQQYITRIYGSLTTFNVLFRFQEDHFVGEKS